MDNTILAGTFGGGVFKSTNNGNSWTAINNGLNNLNVRSIKTDGKIIVAGTLNNAFLSQDNGNSWKSITDNIPKNTTKDNTVNSIEIIKNNILLGINNNLFLSPDQGNTWKVINNDIPPKYVMTLTSNENYIFLVWVAEVCGHVL
ncbi:MAG: hypothetical protein IPJ43_06425 [Saprospiraceae bacterium]|nr:hypothetical protein [Saprospiraceae bacterium]